MEEQVACLQSRLNEKDVICQEAARGIGELIHLQTFYRIFFRVSVVSSYVSSVLGFHLHTLHTFLIILHS